MCFGAVEAPQRRKSVESTVVASVSPASPAPIPADVERPLGLFVHTDGRIYISTLDGVSYTSSSFKDLEPSFTYRKGENQKFLDALANGKLMPYVSPPSSPPQADLLADRLNAAQAETGFKLHDLVSNKDDGSIGEVLGYGRVNLPDGSIERVLNVHYGYNGQDMILDIVHPAAADFVGRRAGY